MDEELQGRVSFKIADGKPQGPWALPRWGVASVGRTTGYGLHVPHSWVPSKLCRFFPYEIGWVVQVGPRPRMRIQGKDVDDHVFSSRSVVALQQGKSLLSFPELDDYCEVAVVIEPGAAAGHPELRDAITEDRPRSPTKYAAGRVVMTPKQRRIVACAFAYLIKGTAKPDNIAAAAAAECGSNTPAVTQTLLRVRENVNKERWGPKLDSHEQLGVYLTHLTRNLAWTDLPEHLR